MMDQQINKKRFEVKSSDGKTTLQCTAWVPKSPVGVVQIVHGMQEYVGRGHFVRMRHAGDVYGEHGPGDRPHP